MTDEPEAAAKPEASDAQVVAACRAGDEAAWRELVARFSRYVYAITRAYRLADADAEDVFQEAFARIYEHLDRLRDDEAIRPWIGQLCRRLCVDRLRAAVRESASEELEQEPELDRRLAAIEDAVSVRVALAQLSPECREILDRFFCRDESYHAIGAALSLPSGTIASRISRCLGKLREKFVGRSAAAAASGEV
jgi:RNA polymerase sigma factor (sigma-70 family)